MSTIGRMQELLGGEVNTGPLRNERDVMRLVRRGLPTQAVDHFLRTARLSLNTLDPQILNRRTFKRRQDAAQSLDPMESDRVLRIVGIVAIAEETLGSKPNQPLENCRAH